MIVGFSVGFLVGVGVLICAYRLSRQSEEEFTSGFEQSGQLLLGRSYKLYIPNLLRKLIIVLFILVGLGAITICGAAIYNIVPFLAMR
jgi:hypothetical protein